MTFGSTRGLLEIEEGEDSQERSKRELWLIWTYVHDTMDNNGEEYYSHSHFESENPLILNFLYPQRKLYKFIITIKHLRSQW